MTAIDKIQKTRLPQISGWKPAGYSGEYSQEAFEALEPFLDDEKTNDKDFPYGELSWFDIMTPDGQKYYAVFGTDNLLAEGAAYCIEVEFSQGGSRLEEYKKYTEAENEKYADEYNKYWGGQI